MSEKDPSFWFWATTFFAAFTASLVAYFNNLRKLQIPFAWLDLILRVATGAIVGLLATSFALSLDYNAYFSGAVAGIAGMFSEQIVNSLEKLINKWFGDQIKK